MASRKNDKKDTASRKGGWTDPSDVPAHNPFAALAAKVTPTAPPPDAPTPRPEPTPAAPAAPRRAVVRTERKGRGGKTVTVVSHLELDPDTLEAWCRDLRKHLGCGGAVEEGTLVVQGDHRDRTAAWLQGRGVGRVTTS